MCSEHYVTNMDCHYLLCDVDRGPVAPNRNPPHPSGQANFQPVDIFTTGKVFNQFEGHICPGVIVRC